MPNFSGDIVTEKDKVVMSEILSRILIEKDIYLRLRMSFILSSMLFKSVKSESFDRFTQIFKKFLYELENRRRIEMREKILFDMESSMAYLSKNNCDPELRYDVELEKIVSIIESYIDEFVILASNKVMIDGLISFNN